MGVYKLKDVTMRDIQKVGGKAASLGELLQTKQRIPNGFVIGADEHRMSPQLEQTVLHLFDELGLNRVAVRSSGIEEDGTEKSWAGQFATILNVDRDGLLQAVEACWKSATSARASSYGQTTSLAVLVQQMVQSDTAGVAFSADPVSGNQDRIVIEAIYGLCEPLVSGTATPDHYVLDKSTGAVIESDIAEKTTMLIFQNGKNAEVAVPGARQTKAAVDLAQLREIADLVRSVEQHYGFPVDIEWTYQDGVLYLLQARPITTL